MIFGRKNRRNFFLSGFLALAIGMNFFVPLVQAAEANLFDVVLNNSSNLFCSSANDCNTKKTAETNLGLGEKYELMEQFFAKIDRGTDDHDFIINPENSLVYSREAQRFNNQAVESLKNMFGKPVSYLTVDTLQNLNQATENLVLQLENIKRLYEAYELATDKGEKLRLESELLLNYQQEKLTSYETILAIKDFKKRAEKSFDTLQRSSRKNMRQYRIVMEYVREELLVVGEFEQPENEVSGLPATEMKRNHESILFDEIVAGIESRRTSAQYRATWTAQKELELYKNLITYFEKPLDNPVVDLRQHTANGDILPGTRADEGTDFVMQNVLPGIINTILIVILSVSVLMLMVGGFLYVSSAGNTEATKKALDMIIWTIVGTIIAVLVFSAVKFIIGIDFTDNEDKLPAQTTDLLDKNGALSDRTFEVSGDPEAGAAIVMGAGLALKEVLGSLPEKTNDSEALDPEGISPKKTVPIEVRSLQVLQNNQLVSENSDLPIYDPLDTRYLPNLTAEVETNMNFNMEVVDWNLKQLANGVVFVPDTVIEKQAIYSSLTNLTGGEYVLTVKVQEKDNTKNVAWSQPFRFKIEESAYVTKVEYSEDLETWSEIIPNDSLSLGFVSTGFFFRVFVDSPWSESAVITPEISTSGYLPDPIVLPYDENLGRPFLYHVPMMKTQAIVFEAIVSNATQTDTVTTNAIAWDLVVDRSLVLETSDYGSFVLEHALAMNKNKVCLRFNLADQVSVDWQLLKDGDLVVPSRIFSFDATDGFCAEYSGFTVGNYTFKSVIVDILDESNTFITPELFFSIHPSVAVDLVTTTVVGNGVSSILPQNGSVLLHPDTTSSTGRMTDDLEFFVKSNLAEAVSLIWSVVDINGTSIGSVTDLSYQETLGGGIRLNFDKVHDQIFVSVKIQDIHFPSNFVTINVWQGLVVPTPVIVNSETYKTFDNGGFQDFNAGDTLDLQNIFTTRNISDVLAEFHTNYGNQARPVSWTLESITDGSVATFLVMDQGGDYTLTGSNNLSQGDYILKIQFEDILYQQNTAETVGLFFSVQEKALLTQADYSLDAGNTWFAIDFITTTIFPYDYAITPLLRFGVNSSWEENVNQISLLNGHSVVSQSGWEFGTGIFDYFLLPLPLTNQYSFMSVLTNINSGDAMTTSPLSFQVEMDRSLFLKNQNLGSFSTNYIESNQSNQVCIESNLGSEGVTTFRLFDSQGLEIPTLSINPFVQGIGYCANYAGLVAGEYDFSFEVQDTLDDTNIIYSPITTVTALDPINIQGTVLSYTDGTLINGSVVIVYDDGNGGSVTEHGLRIMGKTNHTNSTVMVTNAEIQDLTGSVVATADILGTGTESAMAEFSTLMTLPLGSYQIVLEMASLYIPGVIDTVIIPFTTSTFSTFQITNTTKEFIFNGITHTIPADNTIYGQDGTIKLRLQTDLADPSDAKIYNAEFRPVGGSAVGNVITQDGVNALATIQLDSSMTYGDYEFEIEVGDINNPNYTETIIENIQIIPSLNVSFSGNSFADKDGNNGALIPINNEVTPFLDYINRFTGEFTFGVTSDLSNANDTYIYSAQFKKVGGSAVSGFQVPNFPLNGSVYAIINFNSTFKQLFYGDYELALVVGDANNPLNRATLTETIHVVPPPSISLVMFEQANSALLVNNAIQSSPYSIRYKFRTTYDKVSTITAELIPINSSKPILVGVVDTSGFNFNQVSFAGVPPGQYDLHITVTDNTDPTHIQTFINPITTDGNIYYPAPLVFIADSRPLPSNNWFGTPYADGHIFSSSDSFYMRSTLPSSFIGNPQWNIKDANGVIIMDETIHTLPMHSQYGQSRYYKFVLSSLAPGTYTVDFSESHPNYLNNYLIEFDGVYTFNIQ